MLVAQKDLAYYNSWSSSLTRPLSDSKLRQYLPNAVESPSFPSMHDLILTAHLLCARPSILVTECVSNFKTKEKKHIVTSSSPRCHERQPRRVKTWGPMELRVGFIVLTLLYFWAASFAPNSVIRVPQFTFSSNERTSPSGWQLLGLNSKFPEKWKVLWVWRMGQKKKSSSEIWWKVDITAKGQLEMR